MHITLPPPRNGVNVILEPVFKNTYTTQQQPIPASKLPKPFLPKIPPHRPPLPPLRLHHPPPHLHSHPPRQLHHIIRRDPRTLIQPEPLQLPAEPLQQLLDRDPSNPRLGQIERRQRGLRQRERVDELVVDGRGG